MKLAEGRPLRRRMMAAMAQQDCGQCGYNCDDYSDAIVGKSEARLNLCVPGGKETARMLKSLYEEMDKAPAAAKSSAAAHGDVWEFFRNDVLNANSWSNNFNRPDAWDPLPKDKVRWNMFGGTLGGPIIKNKLFFFADYQGQRFDIPSSSSTNTVFTAAQRTGDFSALCSAGFDATGKCLQSGSGNVQLYNPCVSFSAPCTPSSPAATNRRYSRSTRFRCYDQPSGDRTCLIPRSIRKAIGTGLQQNAVNTKPRPSTSIRAI